MKDKDRKQSEGDRDRMIETETKLQCEKDNDRDRVRKTETNTDTETERQRQWWLNKQRESQQRKNPHDFSHTPQVMIRRHCRRHSIGDEHRLRHITSLSRAHVLAL